VEPVVPTSPAPAFPRLGMPAPSFTAETTHGTIRLEDFKTAEAAEERMQAGYECTDWFFCVKDLPK